MYGALFLVGMDFSQGVAVEQMSLPTRNKAPYISRDPPSLPRFVESFLTLYRSTITTVKGRNKTTLRGDGTKVQCRNST